MDMKGHKPLQGVKVVELSLMVAASLHRLSSSALQQTMNIILCFTI